MALTPLWVKTSPSQNDGRTLPQLHDWLRRFEVPVERPHIHRFYKTDPGGKKVKADAQAEAMLDLYDLVAGEEVVVACGAPVVKALLGPVNMAYVHGIPHRTTVAGQDLTVFPMYDPAAGFASKGLMAVIAHDLKALGAFLRGFVAPWAPDPRPMVTKWLHDDLSAITEVYGRQLKGNATSRQIVAPRRSGRGGRLLAVEKQQRQFGLRNDQRRAYADSWSQDDSSTPGVVGSSLWSDSSGPLRASQVRHAGLYEPGAFMAGDAETEQSGPRREGSLAGLAGTTVAAVDSEGWTESPWGLQFSIDGELAHAIRADEPELLAWFNEFVNRSDVRVVMHNGIHDIAVLRAMGIDLARWDDTQLMAYHEMLRTGSGALESEAQNLGTLGYRHCRLLLGELAGLPGVDLDARVIPYTDEVLNYAGQDAMATHRLDAVLWPWINRTEGVRRVYDIDQGQAPLLRHMMDVGMPFDFDDATDYFIEATEKEEASTAVVQAMAERRGLDDFNPRSPDQVRHLITEKYGLRVRKRTKSGKASTNEKALAPHADHPFVQALQGHRELTKLLGTYLQPLMTELSE